MRRTVEATSVSLEEWKKTVRPDWRTWCCNFLPEEVPAISDGFSVFLEQGSDPKRYEKLKKERSLWTMEPEVVLDTSRAEPVTLTGVWDVQDVVREITDQRGGRCALKYIAVFSQPRGSDIMVNAHRLRCAMLVTGHDHTWASDDGRIYLTDAAGDNYNLFGNPPRPIGAIAPIETRRAFEIEMYLS